MNTSLMVHHPKMKEGLIKKICLETNGIKSTLSCNHGPQRPFCFFSSPKSFNEFQPSNGSCSRELRLSQASLASTLRSTPSAFRIHGPCFLAAMGFAEFFPSSGSSTWSLNNKKTQIFPGIFLLVMTL